MGDLWRRKCWIMMQLVVVKNHGLGLVQENQKKNQKLHHEPNPSQETPPSKRKLTGHEIKVAAPCRRRKVIVEGVLLLEAKVGVGVRARAEKSATEVHHEVDVVRLSTKRETAASLESFTVY